MASNLAQLGAGIAPLRQDQWQRDHLAYPVYQQARSHSEWMEVQRQKMPHQQNLRELMEKVRIQYPHVFNSGATRPLHKKKPNLDTMRPLDYLRARNREWLEGVEI